MIIDHTVFCKVFKANTQRLVVRHRFLSCIGLWCWDVSSKCGHFCTWHLQGLQRKSEKKFSATNFGLLQCLKGGEALYNFRLKCRKNRKWLENMAQILSVESQELFSFYSFLSFRGQRTGATVNPKMHSYWTASFESFFVFYKSRPSLGLPNSFFKVK